MFVFAILTIFDLTTSGWCAVSSLSQADGRVSLDMDALIAVNGARVVGQQLQDVANSLKSAPLPRTLTLRRFFSSRASAAKWHSDNNQLFGSA